MFEVESPSMIFCAWTAVSMRPRQDPDLTRSRRCSTARMTWWPLPGMRAFADQELFAPLHIDHVTMEFDGAGTFVGSAHVYAPARGYARLGQLFLNDGVSSDGRRVLPEGWADYSRRSTLGSPYGAGFWTNDGPSPPAAARVARGFPKDGFFASGNRGRALSSPRHKHSHATLIGAIAGTQCARQ
jgi:hypothetical protein